MTTGGRRRPAETVIRLPRGHEIAPSVEQIDPPRNPSRFLGVSTILIGGFILLILIGGGLLTLPIASVDGRFTSIPVAVFTSISAVTVTGHTTVSTPDYWTPFGQAIIFALMTVGGLGFMVISTFLLLVIGSRSTLQEQLLTRGLMRDTVGVEQMQGLRVMGRRVIFTVFALYLAGAVIFYFSALRGLDGAGLLKSLWHSLFLSVSSFNNAGFNIIPEAASGNAARFAANPIVMIAMLLLMALGGLGWMMLMDVWQQRRFSRFTLDTKLVIVTSLFLWLLGIGILVLVEFGNAATMGPFSWTERGIGVVFSSVSGRTAGFAIIDFGEVRDVTLMVFSGLMYIGGASGSVAGGIKVVTFAVIAAAVISSLRGRVHAEAFGREISQPVLHRALAVAVLGLGFILVSMLVMVAVEPEIPFTFLLFDTVSALGTTGASTGIVPQLGLTAKTVLMVAMFLGRLGPIWLALALVPKEDETEVYRFAQERVKIG